MAKNKKKSKAKKKSSLYKSIKPFVKDNRVLLSMLGAAGVGVALAAAFGTDNVKSWIDKISDLVTDTPANHSGKQGRSTKFPVTA